MADVLSQSQFVREAPEIEAQKLALLESSKAQVDATNLAASQGQFLTPNYQIAGMTQNQMDAIRGGEQGIGAYLPYLSNATQQVVGGQQAVATGVDVLRGADTRNQFDPALAAMGRAVAPIASMGQSAQTAAQGVGLISQGGTDIDTAQANLNKYAQANLAPSENYLNQSVGAMNQALPDYNIAQTMVGRGLGQSDLAATQAQLAATQPGFAQGIGSLQAGATQGQTAINQPGFTTATGAFDSAINAARLGTPSDFANEQGIFGQGLDTSAGATARANESTQQAGFGRGVNALYGGAQQGQAATQQAGFDRGVNALYGGAQQGQTATQQRGFDQSIDQGYLAAEQAKLAAAQPGFNQATSTLQQGIGALGGGAQRYDPSSAQGFMNPFQQQVIDESVRQINRQGDLSRQNLQAQATRAGAFGGSREGVQRSELERGLSEQRNAAITGALASGYGTAQQQAQQAFEQQQQRQLAQAQGYQGAAGTQASIAAQQAGLGQSAAQQLQQAAQLEAGTSGTRAGLGLQAAGLAQAAGQGDISAANTRAGLGLQAAGLSQAAGQSDISSANMQGGLGMQAANQAQQQAQFQSSTAQQLANLKAIQQQQGLAQAQAMSGIGSNQASMAGQQAGLGLQAAGLTQNVGQSQLAAAGTQGQLGLSAAQQRAAAGQAGLQAANQLSGMETQGAQLGQSAAQYTGNVGQTLGQQQLQQAQSGQSAASAAGNLGVQQAGLANLYGNIAGQQANIYGQQANANMNLGQGIGGLAAQQFGIGSQLAQGFGGLGTQQGNLATQAAALGQTAQGMGQQDVNFLYNLGSTQQKQQQSELDAQRQNQLQQNMQPYQQLGFLSDIYKGAPSTQMGVTTSSQATPSPFQQVAGLGIAGLSAAAAGSRAGII